MKDYSKERFCLLRTVLDELLDLDDGECRDRLNEVGADDPDLRSELEELLAALADPPAILDGPFAPLPEEADRLVGVKDDRLGSEVGGYRLHDCLGQGGMATVYLAEREHATFAHPVAIKLVRQGMATEAMLRRFHDEQRILASLNHPNIARLYDGGLSDDGQPFIVMELIEGTPLTRYNDEQGLDLDQRLALFETVCAAVEYAHGNLVIHRDLKPSNILVATDGVVKLLDFGVAKLLAPGPDDRQQPGTLTSLYGTPMTPEYAAPELFTGGSVTTAADVYSLGVVLYELLTGERPVSLSSVQPHEVARTVLETEPERPSTLVRRRIRRSSAEAAGEAATSVEIARRRATTPGRLMNRLKGDLDNIVLSALRREPARRYPTVGALREDLERHRRHLPVSARSESLRYLMSQFVRRHSVAVPLALLALLTLVVGLGLAVTGQRAARREARTSDRISRFLIEMFRTPDPTYGRDGSLTAADLLDEAAGRIPHELANEPEIRTRMMQVIGESYQAVGAFDRAELLLQESVTLWRQLHGPYHEDTLAAMNSLAGIYYATGRLEQSEALYREVFEAASKRRPNDALMATILSDFGVLQRERGRLEESEELHRRALAIHRRNGSIATQDAARARNNLAMALRQQGRLEEAEELYQEVLAIQRDILKEPHVDIARTLNNLAAVARRRDDLERAEALYREALDQRRSLLGEGHPDVAQSINNVGSILYYRGDIEDAAAHFEQALAIWRIYFDGDHPRVADALANLGSMRRRQGRFDDALHLFKQGALMQERLFGPTHPQVGLALYRWGSALADSGKPAQALPLLRRAREIQQAGLGDDHSRTVASAVQEARSLVAAGDPRAAREVLHRIKVAVNGNDELMAVVREALDRLDADAN